MVITNLVKSSHLTVLPYAFQGISFARFVR